MKKYISKIIAAATAAAVAFCMLTACNSENDDVADNSGWEDYDGWEDDGTDFGPNEGGDGGSGSSGDGSGDGSGGTENELPYAYPDTAFVGFNGTDRTWCGAEGCYYENANYEFYREQTPIVADFQDGAIISFVVNADYDVDAKLMVRLAVDTGVDENGNWRIIWASDKFDLTVNGQNVNLNGGEDEKWLWQMADWWEPGNFIDTSFGTVNLVSGNNTFVLRTKNNYNYEDHCHILIDCFMIDPV